MNPKERFLAALSLEEPDRVPVFDFLFCQDLFQEVIGRRPTSYNTPDAVELTLKLGLDGIWIPLGGKVGESSRYSPQISEEGVYVDEWGTIYRRSKVSWPIDAPIDYPIKDRKDFDTYQPPNPLAPGRLDDLKEVVKRAKNKIFLIGEVAGPFTVAWLLTGYENICHLIYDDPDFLKELFKIANNFYITTGKMMIEAGADAMLVADDLGFNSGPFIRPEHFRKLILPYLEELIGELKGMGVPVILHCDGNIDLLLDDLVATGISAYHPIERKAEMDLGRIKEKYGRRICLIGNVDSSATLPYGSREDVEEEVKECIRIAAPGGGYILASDHSLHDGIPVKNMLTMIRAAKKYGKYPIRF